ncbi:hypothetical protein ACHAWF_007864, partial [Thalassiosira exigua]
MDVLETEKQGASPHDDVDGAAADSAATVTSDASTPRVRGAKAEDPKQDDASAAAAAAEPQLQATGGSTDCPYSQDANSATEPRSEQADAEAGASSANTDNDDELRRPSSSFSPTISKRLSSSVEHVDLERSLGSLDSLASASKRPRLDDSTGSGSARKKRMSPVPPMRSFAEALRPKFWQDSAAVSKNNISAPSFDVGEEAGGSSPLSDVDDLDRVMDRVMPPPKAKGSPQRRLSHQEERGIAEAEEVMRAAAMAAGATTPDVPDADYIMGETDAKANAKADAKAMVGNLEAEVDAKADAKAETDPNDDFDRQANGGAQDPAIEEMNSNLSSASSLVESYLAEEEYSRPLPPAPPSTPAAPKDAYTPLPYNSDVAGGKLSYAEGLVRRDEFKRGNSHVKFDTDGASTPREDTSIPPPPFPLDDDDDGDDDNKARKEPPESAARSGLRPSRRPDAPMPPPDISGMVTEPRRGSTNAKARRGAAPRPHLAKRSDFDAWEVGDRYRLKRTLGRGSYGEVAQAIDLRGASSPSPSRPQATPGEGVENGAAAGDGSTCTVAIKRISRAFDQEADAVRLFREIHILRRMRDHPCVIKLVDVIEPPSPDLGEFNDLYLVFEYVDTDLYKLIMSPQYLTTEHIQTFLYQMLVGVKYIHSSSGENVDFSCCQWHAMKTHIFRPMFSNILLNEDCTLKICDFGLARIVHNDKILPCTSMQLRNDTLGIGTEGEADAVARHATVQDVTDEASHLTGVQHPNLSRQLTKHVVTRWYRAPELILIQPYTSAVDIWSLGCIFGELLSMQEGSVPTYQDRVPLFPGGSCYPLSGDHGSTNSTDERLDQLSVIFSVIGLPSDEDLESIGKAKDYIKSLGKKPGRSLESLYPAAESSAIDLLKKMLTFNPANRCTAGEALEHEFLKPVRRNEMEICAGKPMESPEFLERSKIDVTMLKEETYKE